MVNGIQATFGYAWDTRDRLTAVSITGYTTVNDFFAYDLFDRRIKQVLPSPGQSPLVTRWTVYDGANPYADFNGHNLTRRYLYGDGVDQLFARYDTVTVSWYLTDNLGSVREIANTSGAAIDDIQYNSFGQVLTESYATNGDRFKFTGREWNGEIGLYYYRERYYDPSSGRFVSEDPLGLASGDVNIYRYVFNMPNGATDPLGLFVPTGILRATIVPKWYFGHDEGPKNRAVICPAAAKAPFNLPEMEKEEYKQFVPEPAIVTGAESPEALLKSPQWQQIPDGSLDELIINRPRCCAARQP